MAAEAREPGAASGTAPKAGPSTSIRLLFIAVASVAVGFASAASIAGQRPSLLSPFSMVVVVPDLILGSPASLGFAPILFVLTGSGLLRRHPSVAIPVICFVSLGTLSALWLAWGYEPGMRHYGAAHTHGLIAVNALSAGGLAALMLHARQRATFTTGLLFHTLTWCWASWSAFGWLRQVFG